MKFRARAIESAPTAPVSQAKLRPRWKQRPAIGVLAALVLAAIWNFGVIELTLRRRMTPYVNGHITFVAARVSGQIARAFVDNNKRVYKGEVLAQLGKEPYEDAVAVKRFSKPVLFNGAPWSRNKARVKMSQFGTMPVSFYRPEK